MKVQISVMFSRFRPLSKTRAWNHKTGRECTSRSVKRSPMGVRRNSILSPHEFQEAPRRAVIYPVSGSWSLIHAPSRSRIARRQSSNVSDRDRGTTSSCISFTEPIAPDPVSGNFVLYLRAREDSPYTWIPSVTAAVTNPIRTLIKTFRLNMSSQVRAPHFDIRRGKPAIQAGKRVNQRTDLTRIR